MASGLTPEREARFRALEEARRAMAYQRQGGPIIIPPDEKLRQRRLPRQSGEQEAGERRRDVRFWALLLAILCCAGISGLNLVPQSFLNAFASTMPQSGECTATPASIQYLAAPGGKMPAQELPAAWFNAGYGQADFAYAQACAASFVVTYQTFDSEHPQTLETCTALLTAGATQRFYGRVAGVAADAHMTADWRASLQRGHLTQFAQAAPPRLLKTSSMDERLLAWFVVPYRLIVQSNGRKASQDTSYSVLLAGLPPTAPRQGTGWQVADWKEGTVVFAPPTPL